MNNSTLKTRLVAILAAASILTVGAFAQKASDFKAANKTWSNVVRDMASFDKIVKAKKWKSVHEAAFAVRDDALLLPGDSKALTPANMTKLKAHLKEIGSLAGELDEAGDANNGKLVTTLAAKFRMHVNMIPSVYPKGAFPMKAAMPAHKPAKKAKHDDHHGGGH